MHPLGPEKMHAARRRLADLDLVQGPDLLRPRGGTVYRCRAPIPELGAAPGDLIFLEPDHATVPIEVVREFGRGHLRTLSDRAEALELVEGPPVVDCRTAPSRGPLRLLR